MRRAFLYASLLLLFSAHSLIAGEPEYAHDVTKWQEVSVPPTSDEPGRAVWSNAANRAKHEWRVSIKDTLPYAQLTSEPVEKRPNQPNFTPEAGHFRGASAFVSVDDGWLIGFNQGEWGGALYWFSRDGKQNYEISDHQIVDFFSLKDGFYAIEGLAHLSISRGSVIRIARSKGGARWEATSVAKLPAAPEAVSVRRDGTILVTLSNSLVSISADWKIQPLLEHALWLGLYPNSSVLSANEQKLYLGMRQFVGEFDLAAKKLRLLIPSEQFRNKLPQEEEERIRKLHSGK